VRPRFGCGSRDGTRERTSSSARHTWSGPLTGRHERCTDRCLCSSSATPRTSRWPSSAVGFADAERPGLHRPSSSSRSQAATAGSSLQTALRSSRRAQGRGLSGALLPTCVLDRVVAAARSVGVQRSDLTEERQGEHPSGRPAVRFRERGPVLPRERPPVARPRPTSPGLRPPRSAPERNAAARPDDGPPDAFERGSTVCHRRVQRRDAGAMG